MDLCTLDDWGDVVDVNTASMAGLVPAVGQARLSAAKHAVVAISKTLRVEVERHGVLISVLGPGAIQTPLVTGGEYGWITLIGVGDDDFVELSGQSRPMEPDKVAERALRAGYAQTRSSWYPRGGRLLVPGSALADVVEASRYRDARAHARNGVLRRLTRTPWPGERSVTSGWPPCGPPTPEWPARGSAVS